MLVDEAEGYALPTQGQGPAVLVLVLEIEASGSVKVNAGWMSQL